MSQLQDNFGRRFHYLRMSVTDVCNFKCTYCLPDGYRPDGKPKFLDLNEIEHLVSAFSEVGTQKVRITGGEPSLRKDFTDIIRIVKDNEKIKTIATTTNGYRLAKHAQEWYDAGLRRINISVDSLDPKMFYQITGENKFDEVMRGVDAALEAGFERVKINAVLLKGLNDKDLPRFLHWIKSTPIDLRFIELMETGLGHDYFKAHHLAGADIKTQLQQEGWQFDTPSADDGPAQNFSHQDYQGRIGLIMPYAKNFCASCNRLRVSAKGKLHLCLFTENGVDLRDLLQTQDQQAELIERLHGQLAQKKETHFLHDGITGVTQHLASIGG
ncbi:GTP 3',8-cyclase MoaA [Shewanella sp. Choline-02u-19]|jgi:cyclic pyranopterin phosphate synthase|uniref:GTP 3',8-cyclase MoaA n=1 Tax=unclassified Shewanella TaxID=196818 RepID=UPI000C33A7B7|nr:MULTISPECIES: GTP 3',8-cyclase MoaA [unclassified Shewanella]PKG55146.1 GTP 3',8-cyclase MoaA [Shewanella sp. GutDb-MelDb]PKG72893.1 GTP 3',8-cyclase MoaA [Shewanella sp. GutCb]PKH58215.1 GTP 3',8-cyclase MoaA [Shewanella sp. Bg11-22]PKI29522.1 GTP 3',8-cyclase MoaA [Shewanella sp. Choline-02u-19]